MGNPVIMHKLFPLAILAGLLAFVVVPAHAAPQLQVGGDGRTIAVAVKDGEQGAPVSVDSPGPPSGETTHQRVIALPTSDGDVEGFKSRGCDVTHRLSIGTGLNCPQAVAKQLLDSGQASVDQLLRVHDLESDTYILADQVWSSYPGFPRSNQLSGYSSFWDTVKYNPAFQGRQMRPDSLKFPVFI